MIMTGQVALTSAEIYAKLVTDGMVDRGGLPVEMHFQAVADGVDTYDEKTVAWLHDLIEDTHVTERDLAREGFSDAVTDAVVLLTHIKEDVTYTSYINEIAESGNLIAIAVKVSDLTHNMRRGNPKKGQLTRYGKALKVLTPYL